MLHLLAVAEAAGVDFTMKDIDGLSRKVPNLCKVAPSSHFHVEDVNRAGGIMAIMGELDRAGLIDPSVKRVDAKRPGAGPGPLMTSCEKPSRPKRSTCTEARPLTGGATWSWVRRTPCTTNLTATARTGCIRDIAHCYSRDGGLAVLYGNIAQSGCIVKTAGVDPALLTFSGPAKVFISQEASSDGILGGEVKAGDVVVIRYEGPKGGPGMQEMLYPTSYLKSMNLGKACALVTDGRFSGGTAGLSIGHVSPEAASGGNIALVRDGDIIEIDIPGRKINVKVF